MPISYTDQQIADEAVRLGLIKASQELPRHLRSRVVAALHHATEAAAPAREARLAREIVVQPNGAILIDGEPFPWLVAAEPMDVRLDPAGVSTVRLTLLAEAVQIIRTEPREEPR